MDIPFGFELSLTVQRGSDEIDFDTHRRRGAVKGCSEGLFDSIDPFVTEGDREGRGSSLFSWYSSVEAHYRKEMPRRQIERGLKQLMISSLPSSPFLFLKRKSKQEMDLTFDALPFSIRWRKGKD